MKIIILASLLALIMILSLSGAVSAADLSVSGNIVKPDLVVTTIEPNAGVGGFMFASQWNVINVTVKNQGDLAANASTLSVNISGNITATAVGTLAVGASSTLTVNDNVIRPAGIDVTVIATADSGGVIDEGNEANNQTTSVLPVFYNGYKGKRWTGGGDLETQAGPFDGRYNITYSPGNTAINGPSWTTKTYSWSAPNLPIPAGATVTNALLYQGYFSNQMGGGANPTYTLSFNGNTVVPVRTYGDRKSFDGSDFLSGVYVYDVTGQFNTLGNSMTITPEAGNTYGILGAYLVVVYQDYNTTVKKIWINDNFDILLASSANSVSSDEATAYATFANVDTTSVGGAKAIAILSSAADTGKSKFFFNSQEYTGFWSNYMAGPGIGFSVYDVTGALASGSNAARLQSYNPGTGGDNMNAMNTILVVEKSEGPVTAQFSATPLSGDKPLNVTFTDASTGYITSRYWSFGDGTFSTGTNLTLFHTYAARGTYDVSLTVTGVGAGNTNTQTKTGYITVKEPAPVINFIGTPTSGARPLTVVFNATNTGGQVNSWAWNFGDGNTSTLQNVTHVYQNEGTYSVCLTATGPDYTDVKIRSSYISVGAATIDLTLTPASINFGTMAAGVNETGSTQVNVTTTGGTGWDVTVSGNNGGYMKAGTLQLASPFQLANGAGPFHDMTTTFAAFMIGTPGEGKTNTANVNQAIAGADQPGAYAITLTFLGGFH